MLYICYSATGCSYLLATKIAYKTQAIDDKCIMHFCMQLKYFSYLAVLVRILSVSTMHAHNKTSVSS